MLSSEQNIFNVQYGIETGVDVVAADMPLSIGSYSVDCTTITGATEEGILVRHGGQMLISGSSVLDSHAVGIQYAPRLPTGGLYASLWNVNVFSINGHEAIGILVGDSWQFMANDSVILEIFGKTKIIGSGAEGFMQSATTQQLSTEVFGEFNVQGSAYSGIFVESGLFISADGSVVSACTSGVSPDSFSTIPAGVVPDIFVDSQASYMKNASAQCTLSLPADIGCIVGCSNNIETALACRAGDASTGAVGSGTESGTGGGKGAKGTGRSARR